MLSISFFRYIKSKEMHVMHYELFLTCPTKESGTGRRDPPYIPYIMARSHARYMFPSLYTALSALCVIDTVLITINIRVCTSFSWVLYKVTRIRDLLQRKTKQLYTACTKVVFQLLRGERSFHSPIIPKRRNNPWEIRTQN